MTHTYVHMFIYPEAQTPPVSLSWDDPFKTYIHETSRYPVKQIISGQLRVDAAGRIQLLRPVGIDWFSDQIED